MPSRGLMKAAPDYATTSFSYTVNSIGSSLERMLNTTEKIPTTILADIPSQSTWANMQTWSTQAAVPAGTSTTPSIDNPRDCCGQVERETDLAQSFVLYFAPVVIGLAIVMCIARLLFNYCTFRALTQPESSHCSSTSHMQSTHNRRHAHHIHTLDHNRIYTIPCERNDSLAQIFMQVPPPNYEQAQKYGRSVTPVALSIDQGPPPYAYQNPLCLNNEQSDPQQSASLEQVHVISSPSPLSNQQQNSVSSTINPNSESNIPQETITHSSQMQSNEERNPTANPPSYTSIIR